MRKRGEWEHAHSGMSMVEGKANTLAMGALWLWGWTREPVIQIILEEDSVERSEHQEQQLRKIRMTG